MRVRDSFEEGHSEGNWRRSDGRIYCEEGGRERGEERERMRVGGERGGERGGSRNGVKASFACVGHSLERG